MSGTQTNHLSISSSFLAFKLLGKSELQSKFDWEEYLVFSLMLLLSAVVGVWFWWRGQKNNEEYLLGGKRQGVLPVALSLVAR